MIKKTKLVIIVCKFKLENENDILFKAPKFLFSKSPLPYLDVSVMSVKLCLQWNDFKENISSAFESLRNDKEFADVTLVFEDGQQLEAHKFILAASSPFFEKILQRSKHSHPLIYLKGFQSKDFLSILDFLYNGKANVYQEDLDSFFAIAEEIQLKNLTGLNTTALVEEQQDAKFSETMHENNDFSKKEPTTLSQDVIPNGNVQSKITSSLAVPNQSRTDMEALDEKVKSIMKRGANTIPAGTAHGKPKQAISWICKLCGKEGRSHVIRDHIETNHLKGICLPCDLCNKTFSARGNLKKHKYSLPQIRAA